MFGYANYWAHEREFLHHVRDDLNGFKCDNTYP